MRRDIITVHAASSNFWILSPRKDATSQSSRSGVFTHLPAVTAILSQCDLSHITTCPCRPDGKFCYVLRIERHLHVQDVAGIMQKNATQAARFTSSRTQSQCPFQRAGAYIIQHAMPADASEQDKRPLQVGA